MRIVDLPREIIALFGDRLDVRERCACRLAHRIFAHINDNRTYHKLTFRTPEHATSRAEASVKLKPQMDTIDITIDGLNDAIDLSPLSCVQHVNLTIIRCGDAYPTGVSGASVYITLSDDNVVDDGLVEFLSRQKWVSVAMQAAHARLLTCPATACKLRHVIIKVDREGAEIDFSLLTDLESLDVTMRCRSVAFKGFEKVTRLDVNHVTELDLAALRGWFTEDALTHGRLEDMQWQNTHWELTRGTDSAESHIVETIRAASPKTRLRLDAWHPGVVRFVDKYVPADMNYEFWCCDSGHGADTYLSARMASALLATRNVPVYCERYTPPQDLVELTGVANLFARMEHDLLRDRWYIAKFM